MAELHVALEESWQVHLYGEAARSFFFSLLSSHCHRLITRSHRLVRNPRKNTPSRGETEMVGKDPTLIYNDNLARVHRRRRGMELERIASGLLLTSHHADKSGSGL